MKVCCSTLLLIVAIAALQNAAYAASKASPPHQKPHLAPGHAPQMAPHKKHGGLLYSKLDGPLAFTITAKTSSAEAKSHNAGKNTSKEPCEIQGADPESHHNNDYKKGPLEVLVSVGDKSVVTLNAFHGTMYKNANLTGSKNVTTVTPSAGHPTTLTFTPNFHTEKSKIDVGVFQGNSSIPSCSLVVQFHAIPSKESLKEAVKEINKEHHSHKHHAPSKAPSHGPSKAPKGTKLG